MKNNLVRKLLGKILVLEEDRELDDFMEKINKSFQERAERYGFRNIEEYHESRRTLFNYQLNRSARYPVTSDL
jgi:stalled ribosome rescue protein Dom34